MIGAANVMSAAAQIACAKPHLSDRIAREMLKVSRAAYARPECRNVAIGHALRAFDRFFPLLQNQRPVLAFARR
jgi:hypothetical protein